MKKILFIDKTQLGLTTDCMKYCEYLQDKYEIHFLCFDMGKPKVNVPNIKVTYVPRFGSLMVRGITFILYAIINVLFFNGFIFVFNFPKCSVLKRILFWKNMHIDIRTLAVYPDESMRTAYDSQLEKDISYFDSSSFISKGIQQKMSLPQYKKTFILPLGADVLSTTDKSFETMQLLYVGTLSNRRIIDTVKGYIEFIKANPNIVSHYDIIGDGDSNELSEIETYIKETQMEKYITLHGRLPYSSLKPYFDSHNIGISYVPMTDYFDYQPPTKTFEYILSGILCLATSTNANKEIITPQNGILHQDTSTSFKETLEIVAQNLNQYNSKTVRDTLLDYQWRNIIEKYLLPIINQ